MLYLSDVGTLLSYSSQELNSCHPFTGAEPRLACEIVDVRDESLEDVAQAGVWCLRIDAVHVLCDVVYGEIFENGHVGFSIVGL